MAAAACSSLILPSKTSPSLRLFFSPNNTTTSTLTTPLTPLPLRQPSPSLSASFTSSLLVPKVALQTDYKLVEAEEGTVQLGSEEELEDNDDDDGYSAGRFSPELKLFVGNLPFSVDSAELAGLFELAGNVEMVEVIYDKMTGKSRGFGFVTMSSVDEVEAAAEQFNGYELKGRALRVNSGPPPPRDQFSSRGPRTIATFDSPNRVYVGNLPWGCDNLALETLFSEQGQVMEAKVVYDRDSGRSRGFGFVTYSTAEEVHNAISSLNGFDFDGRPIRVTMAETRPGR